MSVRNITATIDAMSLQFGSTVRTGIMAPTVTTSSDILPWILYRLGLGPQC